jgi:hypothetical protein
MKTKTPNQWQRNCSCLFKKRCTSLFVSDKVLGATFNSIRQLNRMRKQSLHQCCSLSPTPKIAWSGLRRYHGLEQKRQNGKYGG